MEHSLKQFALYDRARALVSRDSLIEVALVTMPKPTRSTGGTRTSAASRDLRALLHVPQHDLQSQLASRLERLGFPALRTAQVQLLSAIGGVGAPLGGTPSDPNDNRGVRLSDLVSVLSLPKQTVGDLLDELQEMRMVERFPDPDHGVIKRVRLGPKGKAWAAEVRKVSAATEARWATRLGTKKMKSLRALLEELAATVEGRGEHRANGRAHKRG
jgi:DNA-binding MarR family transcriptional regulator